MSNEIELIDGSSRSFKEVFTLSEGKYKMIDIKEEYRKKIRNVYIPEYVTKIDKRALLCCTSLRKLTLPSEAFPFDEDTLYGCDKLTYIKIYKSGDGKIKTYKNKECNIFGNYKNKTIRNIILDGIVSIPKFAFSSCKELLSISLPPSIISIPSYAFSTCSNLQNVYLEGTSIKEIGDYAFLSCKKLKMIRLPETITSIKTGVFKDCKKLQKVLPLHDYSTVDVGVSYNEEDLWRAHILNSLKEIGDEAFMDCSSLSYLDISRNIIQHNGGDLVSFYNIFSPLQIIGKKAFYGCSELETFTIPKTVKSIGLDAFFNCEFLSSIEVEDKGEYYTSEDGVLYERIKDDRYGSLKLVKYPEGKLEEQFIIPKGVKRIEENAFKNSPSLRSVTIHSGIESIGKCAFYNCSSLEEIYIDEREEDSPLRLKTRDWCDNKNIIKWKEKNDI